MTDRKIYPDFRNTKKVKKMRLRIDKLLKQEIIITTETVLILL